MSRVFMKYVAMFMRRDGPRRLLLCWLCCSCLHNFLRSTQTPRHTYTHTYAFLTRIYLKKQFALMLSFPWPFDDDHGSLLILILILILISTSTSILISISLRREREREREQNTFFFENLRVFIQDLPQQEEQEIKRSKHSHTIGSSDEFLTGIFLKCLRLEVF